MLYSNPMVWIPNRYKKDKDRFLKLICDSDVDIIVTSEPWEYREFLKTNDVVVLPLTDSVSSIEEMTTIIRESYACKAIGYILSNDEYDRLQ